VKESSIVLSYSDSATDLRRLAAGLSIVVTIQSDSESTAQKIQTKSEDTNAATAVFESFKSNVITAGGMFPQLI
jgi:hypothetical protein